MIDNNFLEEFSNNILPIYEKHEKIFDDYGIHGRLHISRSIIFSEVMSNFYKKLGKNVDSFAVKYAVSFHDAGRQGNGIDFWENDSSKMCFSYLSKKYSLDHCNYASSLIEKSKDLTDINKNIVYDSDVLEIMRPCCGHGERDGFRQSELRFLSSKDQFVDNFEQYSEIRSNLIEDAWKFIEYTEDNRELFKGNRTLYEMLNIIKKNDYGILSTIV